MRFTGSIIGSGGHNQTNLKLAMIRHDLDVTDAYYKAEQVYNDQLQPVIDQLENEYKAVLYHSPYRDVLEKKLGRITFQNMELAMRSYDERVLELRRE